MNNSKFSEYWAQAQFCYIKADATKYPASKQLWIQLGHDWIALSESVISQSDQENYIPTRKPAEPLLVA
jgi:hypothetical protein